MACAKARGTDVTPAKREGEGEMELRSRVGSWGGLEEGQICVLERASAGEKGGDRGGYQGACAQSGPEAVIERTMTCTGVGRMWSSWLGILGRHEEAAGKANMRIGREQVLPESGGPRASRGVVKIRGQDARIGHRGRRT